jgi:hypothetical protein
MRSDRSGFFWQIITALALGAAFTLLLRWAGPIPMTIVLFILLSLFFLYAIGLARVLLRARRPRARPFGGGGRGEWVGVREPRRPRPPYWPPRSAAAVPEDSEHQQTASSAISGETPQQPLRLEDGLT